MKRLGVLAALLLMRVAALAQGTIPGLTSTPITFSGHADDFVAGPDGNLWLVDYNANAIGRLAVDGSAYQAFPVPTPAAGLNSIVAGPEGNLWFTESAVSKVGRITTSGTITEFTVPAPFVFFLFGFVLGEGTIAAGPDGNLWISGSAQMARVTPQGAVTVVSVPAPAGDSLFEIGKCVAGPDANLWCISSARVAGSIDNHPAKITTAGVATLYPGISSQDFDILRGPDGNLWISANGLSPAHSLMRITPAGVETVYALPTQRESRLAVGADGNIWFTERTTMGNLWQMILASATGDGHATFNSAPITTGYPEGIIAVTSPPGASGIHPEQASAGCPAGVEFEIVTSADYGANITRVKTSAPDTCTHIAAHAKVLRQETPELFVNIDLVCGVPIGVPDPAVNAKLDFVVPGGRFSAAFLSAKDWGDWDDCGVDSTETKLECTAGRISPGNLREIRAEVLPAFGTYNLRCSSETPQIPPSPDPLPDGFDFNLNIGIDDLNRTPIYIPQGRKQ